jgi:hypothetical protein
MLLLALALLVNQHSTFGADADPFCPALPAQSGYTWEWWFAVDAGYCIGHVGSSKKVAFTVAKARLYGPLLSEWSPSETNFLRAGVICDVAVRWYREIDAKKPHQLYYATYTL